MTIPFDAPVLAEALRAYVLGDAPVLALLLDARLRVVDANPQAQRLLVGDVIGRLLTDQFVDFHRTLDLPTLIKQETQVHRLTVQTASGQPETLDFRFFTLPEGVLVFASLDVQEQRRLQDEVLSLNRELNNLTRHLHQANAELRQLNELKNSFIGMAAHDLRKPIGVIMTYSEFVLDEAGERLADEHRGFLRTSLSTAVGMKRLIDNFLDVAVIESGQLRLERSRTVVANILVGALPLIRTVAARKKIELLTAVASDLPTLNVDLAKIQQVVINLVSNAIECSQPGRRVWLRAQRTGSELVLCVQDEGPGIAPEDQQRLFAPFVRAGTRKTSGERSIGLGLALARLVVEAHSGRIWVQSTPGKGSTFSVALPVEDAGASL